MDGDNDGGIAGAVAGVALQMIQGEEEQLEAFMMAIARAGVMEVMRLEDGGLFGKCIPYFAAVAYEMGTVINYFACFRTSQLRWCSLG